MIPPLDNRGLLPSGLHDAQIEEVPVLFCTNEHRYRLWDSALEGLNTLCDLVRQHQDHRPTLVLGGSFFSDKMLPGDIEATLVCPSDTPANICWFWVMQFRAYHAMLKSLHSLDFYPSLPGENDFSAFFQYVGPKTAQDKGLHEKDPRGALRFLKW